MYPGLGDRAPPVEHDGKGTCVCVFLVQPGCGGQGGFDIPAVDGDVDRRDAQREPAGLIGAGDGEATADLGGGLVGLVPRQVGEPEGEVAG